VSIFITGFKAGDAIFIFSNNRNALRLFLYYFHKDDVLKKIS